MKLRRTWREKLADSKDLPRIERISRKMGVRLGSGTMVIPAPIEVDAIMRRVRKGRLTTINDIRVALAKQHRASIACPITTGIFAWISAHAAEEQEREGKCRVTPYWRPLKLKGELNPKYPGGIAAQRRRLQAEGHRVVARGVHWFVRDFDGKLARL